MNLQSHKSIWAYVATTLLLTMSACGGGSADATSDDPNKQPVSKVALIFAEDVSPGPTSGSPYLSVETFELREAKSVDQIKTSAISWYSKTAGQCSTMAELVSNSSDLFGFGEFEDISAGDVITVQSNGSSFAELPLDVFDYSWQSNMVANFPENLVMSIPGEEFPAIDNIIIPYLSDIDVVQQETYLAGSELNWTGSDESELPLWIVLNFGSQVCFAEDNGSFQLPAELTEINSVSTVRRLVSVTRHDDAIVVIMRVKEWES